MYIREIQRAFGVLPDKPVRLFTDNVSSMRIANNIKSTARCRHALRRYGILQQRVRDGDVNLHFVSDEHNPADFLTKWSTRKKWAASIEYASGEWVHATSEC